MKKIWIFVVLFLVLFFINACGPTDIPSDSHEHKYVEVSEVSSTCQKAGVKAHYICDGCKKLFVIREDKFVEVTSEELALPLASHSLSLVAAKEPTETENGNIAYYSCSVCGKAFSDNEGKNEISSESTIIPPLAHQHQYVLVSGVAPTCQEVGMKEYYSCTCGKKFVLLDNEYVEVSQSDLILAKLDHNYELAFTWSADLSSATAKVYCKNCNEVFVTAEATVVSTDLADGIKTVKISYEYLGQTYEETRTLCVELEDETGISVSSDTGLPLGATINVRPLTNKEDINLTIDDISKELVVAFDISLEQDGVGIQPTGSIMISIPYLDTYGNSFKLYHIHGNNAEEVRYQISEGKILFEVSSLSQFVLVEEYSFRKVETTPATCLNTGLLEHYVRNDGKLFILKDNQYEEVTADELVLPLASHLAGIAVRENVVESTCTKKGSYDEVIYCAVCKEELSRTHKESDLISHSPSVMTGKEATCTKEGLTEGSKCSVCGEILVAQQTIPALGHQPGEPVKENEVSSTCTKKGSYDEVIYCSRCGEELSKVHKELELAPHSPAEAIFDNLVETTCSHKGSYDIVINCSICGEELSRNKVDVEKLAHQPSKVEGKPATCTETGLTEGSKCSNCGEILVAQEAIPALGHHLEFVSAKEATENKEGNIAYYSCSVCNKLYLDEDGLNETTIEYVTINPLGHVHNYNYVQPKEATCSEYGMKEHYICAGCNKLFILNDQNIYQEVASTDLMIDLIAHKGGRAVKENEVSSTCTKKGSYDEVIYCSVCGEELSRVHIELELAPHSPITLAGKEATCTETGLTEGSKCSICNEILKAQEVIPALGHKPGDQEKENIILPTCQKEGSYDEVYYCSICGIELSRTKVKLDITDHTPSKAVRENEVPATCGQAGSYDEVIYCSVCEEELSRTQKTIPATGKHTYVDGVCSICGKEKPTECDHQELHEEKINLAELGFCGGIITYKTCDCGEVAILDEYHSYVMCHEHVENDYSDTEMSTICHDCGLAMYGYREEIKDEENPCLVIVRIRYEFYDKVKNLWLKTVNDNENYQHKFASQKVFDSNCKTCNGGLLVNVCQECGEISNLTFTGEIKLSNKEGNSYTCPDCQYTYVLETTKSDLGYCQEEINIKASIYDKDNVLVITKEAKTTKVGHEFERRAELIGTDCNEGVLITEECKYCGFTRETITFGHAYNYEERKEINLKDYGACGGVIQYRECLACGEKYIIEESIICEIKSQSVRTETIDGITYQIFEGACDKCGLNVYSKMWTISNSCVDEMHVSTKIYMGEEVLFEVNDQIQQRSEHHQFTKTYKLEGKTCDDGVWITETCSVCGTKREYHTTSHVFDNKTIDLKEHGACGGVIQYQECLACGEKQYLDGNPSCHMTYTNRTETIDGITYQIYEGVCDKCGLNDYSKMWTISNSCVEEMHVSMKLYMGEEVLLEINDQILERREHHEIETTFEYVGKTCEDGVLITEYCKNCDLYKQYKTYSHQYEEKRIDLSEYGACDGTIYYRACKICQKIDNCRVDTHSFLVYNNSKEEIENGIHIVTHGECSKCGLIYNEEIFEYELEECNYHIIRRVSLSVGSYNFECTFDRYETKHNFIERYELLGKTCKDGYTVYMKCDKCGLEEKPWTNYEHLIEYELTDLSKEYPGLCSTEVHKEKCKICGEVFNSHFNESYHKFEHQEDQSSDDEYIYVCRICGLIKSEIRNKEINGCHVIENRSVKYIYHDEIIFENTMVYEYQNHNYIESYELLGESCKDGYIVYMKCDKCGLEEKPWTDYEHRREHEFTDLTEQYPGLCHTEVYKEKCRVCGEVFSSDFNESYHYFEQQEDQSSDDEFIYVCRDCGLIKSEIRNKEINGCNVIENINVKYIYNDEIIFENTMVYEYQNHDYKINVIFDNEILGCVGGYNEIMTCSRCKETKEDHYDSHPGSNLEYFYKVYGEGDNRITIGGYYCTLCHKVDDSSLEYTIGKNYQKSEYKEVIDGHEYDVSKYYNSDINASFIWQYYTIDLSDCVHYDINEILIDFEDEHDKYELVQYLPTHEYVYENIDWHSGEHNCNYGVSYLRRCKICGEETPIDDYRHHFDVTTELINQNSHGEDYYIRYLCPVCGYMEQYFGYYGQSHNYIVNTEETEDEKGNKVEITTKTCTDCGAVMTNTLVYYPEGKPCNYRVEYRYQLSYDGNVIKEFGFARYETTHDLVHEYEFVEDQDCENGVYIVERCQICGEIFAKEYFEGHQITPYSITDEDIEGLCCTIYYARCDVCGEIVSIEFDDDDAHDMEVLSHVDEENYSREERVCTKCGIHMITTITVEVDDDGVNYQNAFIQLLYNNEVLLEANKRL